ncbi:transmembrane protein 33 isoform X2 [Paroedura picta]|uniref:transmembrane protein 33 isoform X2 n=1 Tax=Paroedura picta TaxID=143630 RepID=UPI004056F98B
MRTDEWLHRSWAAARSLLPACLPARPEGSGACGALGGRCPSPASLPPGSSSRFLCGAWGGRCGSSLVAPLFALALSLPVGLTLSFPGCGGAAMADTAQNGPMQGGAGGGAVQFLMTNKLDTAMWLSRIFTVYCSALFVLPLLGLHEAASFYQRALLANALTSALRLHQRLPHFQLSRAFLAQALLEDSCHYLLYSLIFVNSYPVTMSIFPVLLFSLLHAATYTKKVLDARGSNSLLFLRNLLDKLNANQQNILKFIACNEIFLMPATVFMLFSGQGSLLQPFIYYRFLTLRYSSRRNPYCRTLFTELRIVVEHVIMKPLCPVFVRRLCLSGISFISRLAPTVA